MPKFYFDDTGQEVPIPLITDPPSKLKEYYRSCIQKSDPRFTAAQIDEVFGEFTSKKPLILEMLNNMAKEAGSEPGEKARFRAAAYRKAAAKIKSITAPIITAKQAKLIEGVGPSIAKKIEELVMSGKTPYSEEGQLKSTLKEVWGAGPSVIKEWVEKGVGNIEDLRNLVQDGTIILDEKQTIGLDHYEDLLEKIPRKEIGIFGDLISMGVETYDPEAEVHIVGSYARGQSQSSDIDILVISNKIKSAQDIKKVIESIKRTNAGPPLEPRSSSTEKGSYSSLPKAPKLVIKTGSMGPQQFMGVMANPLGFDTKYRRVDIFFRTPQEKVGAMIQFTSSAGWNERVRGIAKSKGMMLNDKGLWLRPNGGKFLTRIPVESEEEIFERLGIKWVPVEERV